MSESVEVERPRPVFGSPASAGVAALLPMFATALFMSATLLFCVQPMIGKMLLPLLGGAPAVWITCMLFFQAALLVGYGYSHLLTRYFGVRTQVLVHGAVLLVPLLFLPIAFDPDSTSTWDPVATPVWRLMGLLAVNVGLPFMVVSTSAPLLQKWFSSIGHPSGKDPYFLYAASNAGSMLALAAYPALLEPTMHLPQQSSFWRWAYVGFIGLVLACGAVVWRRQMHARETNPSRPTPPLRGGNSSMSVNGAGGSAIADTNEESINWPDRIRWIALAFVPSSMLLGVTTYVTTDIAATPLFWVLPLALYLLTFILVFATKPPISFARSSTALAFVTTLTVLIYLAEFSTPAWAVIAAHLALLFFASMVGHGALANDRPPTKHLTEFYFWISVGGVLGGIFNGILAPLVFDRIIEYPLAIALACLCRATSLRGRDLRRDILIALGLGIFTVAVLLLLRHWDPAASTRDPVLKEKLAFIAIGLFAIVLIVNHTMKQHPVRYALGIGAVLAASYFHDGTVGRTLFVGRDFFGVVKVSRDQTGRFVQIVHGSTVHGRQHVDPARRLEPTSYYHRTGPLGQVFEMYRASPAPRSIGAIGLGAGNISGYARPGENWTYYEIDPLVDQVARDTRFFTFLRDAFPDPSAVKIELGDARFRIRSAPERGFGLIILDAFSSDAVPVHLVTREAMAVYLSKLAPNGILAVNISNRHLDLRPVFAGVARDAGLLLYNRPDYDVPPEVTEADGKFRSSWLVAAREPETLAAIANDPRWKRLEGDPNQRVWTDDFSNLLSVYHW